MLIKVWIGKGSVCLILDGTLDVTAMFPFLFQRKEAETAQRRPWEPDERGEHTCTSFKASAAYLKQVPTSLQPEGNPGKQFSQS